MDDREHRWLGIEAVPPSRHTAVCSCGWRSAVQPNAGLAGSHWDRHEDAMRDLEPGDELTGTDCS